MKPVYEIRSGALAGFNQLVPHLGGDPASLLARVGLPQDCMRRPDLLVPVATLCQLLNICADELQCQDFGLRLASMQGMRMLGAVGQLLGDTDLEAALAVTQRYMALHNQAEHWRMRVEGDLLVAERYDHFQGPVDARQYRELSMAACYRLMQDLAGMDVRPRTVMFRQEEPAAEPHRYREFFYTEVLFGQERDCLVFDAEVARRPVCPPSPSLLRYFEDFTRQLLSEHRDSVAEQVRTLILQTLGAQRHSLAQVARLMGVPARTLQRRLSAEKTSFKQLVQDARMQTARWHLCSSSIDINLLSATLGYTDISAFSKAFRAIHGKSPLQWRKQQRDAD
ncbi:AraC family transcriptional regulator [Microbulbifer yueqingensis]|uniref:AraC-type DNA-binding protein n=1 Tax=Microbulbifer yueqingensis TaxID=658219 RepID=A0A1G8XV25_9GAMM|nr:AraC family transcriptional regulator [Microbulbifer yueqingensis]SDJ94347.1 AraC-type DNA-binding protein [Microbulbifer yueqingensis]